MKRGFILPKKNKKTKQAEYFGFRAPATYGAPCHACYPQKLPMPACCPRGQAQVPYFPWNFVHVPALTGRVSEPRVSRVLRLSLCRLYEGALSDRFLTEAATPHCGAPVLLEVISSCLPARCGVSSEALTGPRGIPARTPCA